MNKPRKSTDGVEVPIPQCPICGGTLVATLSATTIGYLQNIVIPAKGQQAEVRLGEVDPFEVKPRDMDLLGFDCVECGESLMDEEGKVINSYEAFAEYAIRTMRSSNKK